MKIYEKIVIDIETNAIIEEVSSSYNGPVAYCGGGDIPDPGPAMMRGAELQAQSAREALQQYLLPSLAVATKLQYPWSKAGMEALGRYSQLMGLQPETWQWPASFEPRAYAGLYPPNIPAGAGARIAEEPGLPAPAVPAADTFVTPTDMMPEEAISPGAGGRMFPEQVPVGTQLDWLQQMPGYQFQLGEGLRALQQQAAGRGMRLGGPTLRGISDYAQDVATNYYQNYLNQLANLWGGGQQTAAQLGGQALQGAGQAALAQAGIGQALGSGYAQAAQAQMQQALAQQQQRQGLWGNILGGIGTLGGLGLGLWALSDKRTKKNIRPFNALNVIRKLRPARYEYKSKYGGGSHIGFIADEVEQVYPAAVAKNSQGLRMINVLAMNALNVKALQDQQRQIDKLRKQKDAG